MRFLWCWNERTSATTKHTWESTAPSGNHSGLPAPGRADGTLVITQGPALQHTVDWHDTAIYAPEKPREEAKVAVSKRWRRDREMHYHFLSFNLAEIWLTQKLKSVRSGQGKETGRQTEWRDCECGVGIDEERGNEQWNERMTQPAILPIINFYAIPPMHVPRGVERQQKKA